MKTLLWFTPTLAAALLLTSSTAPQLQAQRGIGDREGVVRQGTEHELADITGKIVRTEEGPCKQTTGRAYIGTHFFVELESGTVINLHLGPADAVRVLTDSVRAGDNISVRAFRTARLQDNHYVAIRVTAQDRTYVLRDDDLKPVWSGGRGASPWMEGRGGNRGQRHRGGR